MDLLAGCGGKVLSYHWTDYDKPQTFKSFCWNMFRYVFTLRIYPLLHLLVPQMRNHIVIKATKESFQIQSEIEKPPLAVTGEFGGKVLD